RCIGDGGGYAPSRGGRHAGDLFGRARALEDRAERARGALDAVGDRDGSRDDAYRRRGEPGRRGRDRRRPDAAANHGHRGRSGPGLAHVRKAWDAAHPDAPLAEQEVVLTVPASFDEAARELTLEAAQRAGLTVRLLEEPQAAFYDYMQRAGSAGGGSLARASD